jgi:hypothetical protein
MLLPLLKSKLLTPLLLMLLLLLLLLLTGAGRRDADTSELSNQGWVGVWCEVGIRPSSS